MGSVSNAFSASIPEGQKDLEDSAQIAGPEPILGSHPSLGANEFADTDKLASGSAEELKRNLYHSPNQFGNPEGAQPHLCSAPTGSENQFGNAHLSGTATPPPQPLVAAGIPEFGYQDDDMNE